MKQQIATLSSAFAVHLSLQKIEWWQLSWLQMRVQVQQGWFAEQGGNSDPGIDVEKVIAQHQNDQGCRQARRYLNAQLLVMV